MTLPKQKIAVPKARKPAPGGHVDLGSAALKKAGGSLTLVVPASARDALHLVEGSRVNLSLAGDHLILTPMAEERPRYTLDELVAQCDFDASLSDAEREWLDAPPVGRELI